MTSLLRPVGDRPLLAVVAFLAGAIYIFTWQRNVVVAIFVASPALPDAWRREIAHSLTLFVKGGQLPRRSSSFQRREMHQL